MFKLLSSAIMVIIMVLPAHAAHSLDADSVTFVDPGAEVSTDFGTEQSSSRFGTNARGKSFPGGKDGSRGVKDAQTTAISTVPEPGTWGMVVAGAGIVGFAMRRRSKVRKNASFV